ncbi:MAG: hypothetical protein HOW73_44470 [Polyangiaceae bacterium]|nr:hypothetical protein [Polyangiaceae bacterium]
MRFFYRMAMEGPDWIAECEELESFGRGATPGAALDQLRDVIAERLDRPFAVAPPEDARPIEIDLVPLDEAYRASLLDEYELSH